MIPAVWIVALVTYLAVAGVTTERFTIVLWIVTGLIAFTIGRRPWWQAPLDWSPIIVFFLAYDYARGAAERFGFPTQWTIGPDFDRWMFNGTVPTIWLQEHFAAPFDAVPWWEALTGIVYMSHFFAAFLLAGVLWIWSRRDFKQFMVRLAAISFISLACYVVVPGAPPWAAGRCTAEQVADHPYDPPCLHRSAPPSPAATLLGELQPRHEGFPHNVQRLSARGWKQIPVVGRGQALIDTGIDSSNRVAAIPSLHAATALLVGVFLWPRLRRRWRPLLVAYPLAMAGVLMWTGDHYVFDVLAGWLVVLVVVVSVGWAERRWFIKDADEPEPIRVQSTSE